MWLYITSWVKTIRLELKYKYTMYSKIHNWKSISFYLRMNHKINKMNRSSRTRAMGISCWLVGSWVHCGSNHNINMTEKSWNVKLMLNKSHDLLITRVACVDSAQPLKLDVVILTHHLLCWTQSVSSQPNRLILPHQLFHLLK